MLPRLCCFPFLPLFRRRGPTFNGGTAVLLDVGGEVPFAVLKEHRLPGSPGRRSVVVVMCGYFALCCCFLLLRRVAVRSVQGA